ncbi:MAG: hypothetical protein K0Q72_1290 [Armatimonadetes bacterium]|nr:hypothetical protein [Armatimonadota bacterium]
MLPALLSLFLFLAPPPDLATWRESPLPSARMVVETPRELTPVTVAADAAYPVREQWTMKYGFMSVRIDYMKHARPPGLTAKQFLEAYGGGIISKKPGARAEFNERMLLGKPGFDLRIIDADKAGINTRTCMMRDGVEEWRWEVNYAPEFEEEETIDHFFNSIRALPAPALPAVAPVTLHPSLTLSLPGKPESKEQTLTEEQKKSAKSMTVHTLVLPDGTTFYMIHAEYLEGVEADLKSDFTGLLTLALSKSKDKESPKIELVGIPNASGYRTRGRTLSDKTPATYRVASFTTGRQGWGILMVAPNTVRHEKLLDDVSKSMTVTK